MRSATAVCLAVLFHNRISIHALRAECGLYGQIPVLPLRNFNPRTPCGVRHLKGGTDDHGKNFNPRTPCGVRQPTISPTTSARRFQSTHSVRSATLVNLRSYPQPVNFNPRTPCGVRPFASSASAFSALFQSTHSVRSATYMVSQVLSSYLISIHALRAECDTSVDEDVFGYQDFNPRTPCGVRPCVFPDTLLCIRFQSTHSVRSATRYALAL